MVKEKRPSYLFLENVVGLLSHDRGRTFGVILSALYDLGYHVEWTVLNSKHFGVPQSRRRLFLVGYLDPRCAGKILPVFGADAKALVQIVHGRLGKRVYDSAGIACTQDTSRQSGLYFVDLTKGDPKITQNARCLHTRQDGSLTNFKGQNSGVLYIKEATKKGYKEAHEGDSIDLGFAGSNTRRGRVFAGVAHTVDTANTHGIVLRGGRVRRLMPRECFRLQGFSEDQIDKLLAINSDAQAYDDAFLTEAVRSVFDVTPTGMIRALNLDKPFFAEVCNNCHFMHPQAAWEQTDKTEKLRMACAELEDERT